MHEKREAVQSLLMGENGAGKSTLLKAILGENEYSGSLTFVDGNDKMSRRPIIGYVPQKLDFDYSFSSKRT